MKLINADAYQEKPESNENYDFHSDALIKPLEDCLGHLRESKGSLATAMHWLQEFDRKFPNKLHPKALTELHKYPEGLSMLTDHFESLVQALKQGM